MNNDSVKDNIRSFRKSLHVTQAEMADRLGISRTAYRNIENGDTRLLNENLERIAGILSIETEELVLGYHPQKQTHTERILTEKHKTDLSKLRKTYETEVRRLEAKITGLSSENANLRHHIATLTELIHTKNQVIDMLKKEDLK